MDMNTIIQRILDNQQYDGYNLKYNISNYTFTNKEHILIHYDVKDLHFFHHKDAGYVIKVRFNTIIPYLQSYFRIRKPNTPISFIMGLGDFDENPTDNDLPVLCFAKKINLKNILIPNIDFFSGTINTHIKNVSNYDIDFNQKINGSCFAGSSTGSMENNKRIRYCLSVSEKTNHVAKITDLTQGSLNEWKSYYPTIESIIDNKYYNTLDQLQYKILVNIDGNSLCYSRLYWQILSNSAVVYVEPDTSYTQFFDTDELNKFYFTSSIENVDNVYNYILDSNNYNQIMEMKSNGKKYLQNCFQPYLENKEQFLSNVFVSILDRLIERNNHE
jgi:hypothetical protein